MSKSFFGKQTDFFLGIGAFALLLLCLVIDWKHGWLVYDQHRVFQILLLAVVFSVVVCFNGARALSGLIISLPSWAQAAVALFFGLGVMTQGLSFRFALLEWATFVLLAYLVFLIAQNYINQPSVFLGRMVVLLAAVGAVVLVKVMTGYVAALIERTRLDTVLLFDGTFSNRRFFGQIATLLIPLFVWAGIFNIRFRAAWFVLACMWWMLVFVSGTRGTWLALAVAHAGILVWGGRQAFAFVGVQILLAILGLGVYWVLFYGLPPLLDLAAGIENRLDDISSLSGRGVIWSLAWQSILDHPWLGIGPMHFAAIPNSVAAHPHNAILQLAAEWGIPAAVTAVVLVLGGLAAFARPLRQQADMLRLALLTSLLAACVQSQVDGVIVIPYTQSWLAVVAGWALGVHWSGRELRQISPSLSRAVSIGLRVWGGLALGFLAWGVWPEILNRPEAAAAYLERFGMLAPRYWAQGWIDAGQ